MIVVADTSPLNYLIQIDCDHLLPTLYGTILIPHGVLSELHHPSAPASVKTWLRVLPAWIETTALSAIPDPELSFLGLGEREAIQVAQEQHADLLLMDERLGRIAAGKRGLRTTGTLGVLLTAAELNRIDPVAAFRRLIRETTFRTYAALEAEFFRLTKRQN